MQHFSDEAWSDFTRNLLPAEEMARMREHLRSGCGACVELQKLWDAVRLVASRAPNDRPDEAVVDTVKAAYATKTWTMASPLESLTAALVFDSLLGAEALAGVRSTSLPPRRLLYRVGTLAIDLQIDTSPGKALIITGQVLHAGAESAFTDRGEVSLLREGAIVSRTVTNQFGEFRFESDHGPDLRIRVAAGGREPVLVVLPEYSAQA